MDDADLIPLLVATVVPLDSPVLLDAETPTTLGCFEVMAIGPDGKPAPRRRVPPASIIGVRPTYTPPLRVQDYVAFDQPGSWTVRVRAGAPHCGEWVDHELELTEAELPLDEVLADDPLLAALPVHENALFALAQAGVPSAAFALSETPSRRAAELTAELANHPRRDVRGVARQRHRRARYSPGWNEFSSRLPEVDWDAQELLAPPMRVGSTGDWGAPTLAPNGLLIRSREIFVDTRACIEVVFEINNLTPAPIQVSLGPEIGRWTPSLTADGTCRSDVDEILEVPAEDSMEWIWRGRLDRVSGSRKETWSFEHPELGVHVVRADLHTAEDDQPIHGAYLSRQNRALERYAHPNQVPALVALADRGVVGAVYALQLLRSPDHEAGSVEVREEVETHLRGLADHPNAEVVVAAKLHPLRPPHRPSARPISKFDDGNGRAAFAAASTDLEVLRAFHSLSPEAQTELLPEMLDHAARCDSSLVIQTRTLAMRLGRHVEAIPMLVRCLETPARPAAVAGLLRFLGWRPSVDGAAVPASASPARAWAMLVDIHGDRLNTGPLPTWAVGAPEAARSLGFAVEPAAK